MGENKTLQDRARAGHRGFIRAEAKSLGHKPIIEFLNPNSPKLAANLAPYITLYYVFFFLQCTILVRKKKKNDERRARNLLSESARSPAWLGYSPVDSYKLSPLEHLPLHLNLGVFVCGVRGDFLCMELNQVSALTRRSAQHPTLAETKRSGNSVPIRR